MLKNILLLLFITFSFTQEIALHFDGVDDHVSIPDNNSLDFEQGNSFSIQVKFKSTGNNFGGILTKAEGNYIGWQLFVTSEFGGNLLFHSGNNSPYLYGPSYTEFVDGELHDITIVYNADEDKAYFYFDLDSEDDTHYAVQSGYSSINLSNSGPLIFGTDRNPEDGVGFWDGIIDDVKIWHKALSKSEIIQINQFNNFDSNDELLAGFWGINEGSGNIVHDNSGNENHGQIIDNPEWIWSDGNENVHVVPQEYSTIQLAIDASSNGDIVQVSPGVYFENIEINSKNISVVGESPSTTWIDGGSSGSVVRITDSNLSSLSNFLIKSGNSNEGGGIYINDASPQITNCRIAGNNSSDTGGGIFGFKSNAVIDRCAIYNNSASVEGSAIKFLEQSNPLIINSTIVPVGDNWSIISTSSTTIQIKNSIITDDKFYAYPDTPIDITFSLIQTEGGEVWEGEGNISGDPLFNEGDENYTLQQTSPCIDKGDPDFNGDGEDYTTDTDDQDPDGTRMDMGAYYFHQTSGCTDELACNYDVEASIDDGSCDYSCINENYSLSFNGEDDYVKSLSNVGTDFSEGVAFDVTFQTSEYNTNTHTYIISQYSHVNFDENNACAELGIHEGQLFVHIRDNAGTSVDGLYGSELADNNWHTAKVTYDGVNGYLSVNIDNDIYFSDTVNNIGDIQSPSPFYLGAQQYHGHNFNGNIRGVKVWNSAVDLQDENANNDDYLVLNYPISHGSGTVLFDYSGSQNHGTIYGAEWINNTEGCTDEEACNYDEEASIEDGSCDYSCIEVLDYSLSFDGIDDYVDLGQSVWGSLPIGTVSGSFNLDNLDNTRYIIGESSYSGYGALALRVDGSGLVWCSVNNGALGSGCSFEFPSGTVSAGQWYNYSITWDNSSRSFYLYNENGLVVDSTQTDCENGTSDNIASDLIGKSWDMSTWLGDIDNLSVWNIYMDQSDIENYIVNNPTGEEEGLIAYYKFSATYDDLLIDFSGNQNHGTINGAEWSCNISQGDLNNDCVLDIVDIVAMINYIINLEYNEQGDMNGDGELNILDVLTLLYSILNS